MYVKTCFSQSKEALNNRVSSEFNSAVNYIIYFVFSNNFVKCKLNFPISLLGYVPMHYPQST